MEAPTNEASDRGRSESDRFSHRCDDEPKLRRRLVLAGYLPCGCSWGIGENIAWGGGGLGAPLEIVKAWMSSREHRASILSRSFEHIGVGAVWGSPQDRQARAGIYTTVFGYRD